MNRIITAVLLLIASASTAGNTQTLNCQVAFTKLEQAICGDASLIVMHGEMSATSAEAVASGTVSEARAEELRNHLARSCREADELEMCLASGMQEAMAVLSHVAAEQSSRSVSRRGDAEPESLRDLQHWRFEAEKHFAANGDPIVLVNWLLALQQRFEQLSLTDPAAVYEAREIRARLLFGCSDPVMRSKWNKALQTYGRACPVNHAANTLG